MEILTAMQRSSKNAALGTHRPEKVGKHHGHAPFIPVCMTGADIQAMGDEKFGLFHAQVAR